MQVFYRCELLLSSTAIAWWSARSRPAYPTPSLCHHRCSSLFDPKPAHLYRCLVFDRREILFRLVKLGGVAEAGEPRLVLVRKGEPPGSQEARRLRRIEGHICDFLLTTRSLPACGYPRRRRRTGCRPRAGAACIVRLLCNEMDLIHL